MCVCVCTWRMRNMLHNACLDQKLNCAISHGVYVIYILALHTRARAASSCRHFVSFALLHCRAREEERERACVCVDWARLLCDRLNSKLLSVLAPQYSSLLGKNWAMPSLKINHTIFRFVLVIRVAAVALFWLDLWPSIFGNLLSTSMLCHLFYSSICFIWLTQSIASHFISHRISKMIINLSLNDICLFSAIW